MVSAFLFFEDFELCTFNLPGYPLLGLPGDGTDSPTDDKGGERNPWDYIAPVLKGVIQ